MKYIQNYIIDISIIDLNMYYNTLNRNKTEFLCYKTSTISGINYFSNFNQRKRKKNVNQNPMCARTITTWRMP